MFVCFAPRENPKIAIAVAVENAGFGATWAAPMASLMIEKYLNDTLRTERIKEVDRIGGANLMPKYLEREQYKADSVRAFRWYQMTKDSNYIRKYLRRIAPSRPKEVPPQPKPVGQIGKIDAIPEKRYQLKKPLQIS
jgi:penicillin-binding protein 2